MLQNLRQSIIKKISSEFQCPTKSLAGYLVSNYFGLEKRLLENRAIRSLNIQPDDNVLELGCSNGDGLLAAFQCIENGSGRISGVDRSKFMTGRAKKKCAKEISEGRIDVHWSYIEHMPFPTNVYDKIFHCNEYYFWTFKYETMLEIMRVMKPGGIMVCALKIAHLKRLEISGYLPDASFDPLDYMDTLERVGFENVGIEYFDHDEVMCAQKPMEVAREVSEEDLLDEEYEFTKHFVIQQRIAKMKRINTDIPVPPDKIAKEEKS